MSDLPWPKHEIPAWAEYLAQDADGTWWAYEAHPNEMPNGWYENEVGRIQRLGRTAPPEDCHATLIRLADSATVPGLSGVDRRVGEASSH